MTIGIKSLRRFALVLPFLVGQASTLAQQPGVATPIGAADLFRKTDDPSRDDSTPFAVRSPDVMEQIDRFLAMGGNLCSEGRYDEAEVLYAAAASLAERSEGGPSRLFISLCYQAYAVASQGRLDGARALIDQATRQGHDVTHLNRENLDFLFWMTTQVYQADGKIHELETILGRLYSIAVHSLGGEDPSLIRYVIYRGQNLIDQEKLLQAEELLLKLATGIEANQGLEAPVLDEVVDRMLKVYDQQAKFDKATQFVWTLLEKREGRLGRNQEKVAETLLLYAKRLEKTGRGGEAERCIARAIGIRCRNGVIALVASRRAALSFGRLNRSGV